MTTGKQYLAEDQNFYTNNPKVLFQHLDKLIPNDSYSQIDNLNILMRFFIVVGLIITLWTSQIHYILLSSLLGFLLTYYMFKKSPVSEKFEPSNINSNLAVDDLGNVCQLPTPDNPFGNMLPGDDPARLPACSAQNTSKVPVAGMIDKYFKLGLYRDVNDVFDRNNSQREFVTMPATANPNARDELAKWCFNSGSCRDGQMDYCLRTTSYLIP